MMVEKLETVRMNQSEKAECIVMAYVIIRVYDLIEVRSFFESKNIVLIVL